jgi:hypothetical protein
MTNEKQIDFPVIDVPVHCGMVKKAIVREITNASQYEYETTLKVLCKTDKAFAEEYAIWKESWSLSEKLALKFVTFLYPGYRIRVVLR